MSYYIVESPHATIEMKNTILTGMPTSGHTRALWLYVVDTDESPAEWPEAPSGRAGIRHAPVGVENWWVVNKRSKAHTENGVRSDGNPMDSPPLGFPVFRWPLADADEEGSPLVDDLKFILGDGRVGSTEKESLIIERIGQGAFRHNVLKRWGQRCAVTGSATLEAIRASHIKPWRESSDEERLDPGNGLPLVASLDALFDAGLISFDATGILILSSRLHADEQTLFGLAGRSLRNVPPDITAGYLEYHREHVLQT